MSVNALLKPRSIEVETAEGNPYSATVTMEPFMRTLLAMRCAVFF